MSLMRTYKLSLFHRVLSWLTSRQTASRQEACLRDLRASPGFLVGAGPCAGPVSRGEPNAKYPIVAIDASRWFVVDVDVLDPELQWFLKDTQDSKVPLVQQMETREHELDLPAYRFFWLAAVIPTDTGAQFIYEASFAGKATEPGDPRYAFWSGQRGFFPVRLVNKKDPRSPRQMIVASESAYALATAFNEAAQRAALLSDQQRDAMPFLDEAWRSE